MKKKTLIRREVRQSGGEVYEYELFVRKSEEMASFHLPLYSVGIKLTEDGERTGNALIDDAFSSAEKAICFFNGLVESLTPPSSLAFLLDEALSN